MNKEELININGIREDLFQAMQIGDITLNSKQSQKLYEFMNYQDKEIERLNNIINELNCGIKELDNMFYETFRISQNGYYSISEWVLKEFTDKIKELKGSDK